MQDPGLEHRETWATRLNTPGGPYDNRFNLENQWTNQNTFNVTYLYDGDGQRVMASGGASGTRVFWYDEAGNVIEEEDGSNVNEYLYLGNQRIARIYNLFTPYYYYSDYLGTSRVSADENGNKCYDADYFPWGDEQQVYVNTCPQNYKFNGKERDPDMGVYYFGARFMQDAIARFYSPDWSATVEPVPYAKLNNPQSLNLYTYVLDNPLSFRDADGHEVGADTLQELQKITSDSGNAAQNTTPETLSDPSKLGPEWVKDDTHKNPNGERYGRGDGTRVDFDKGQKGAKGWRGKDHWHVIRPGENKPDKSLGDRGHIAPGTTVDLPTFAPKFSPTVPIPSELLPNPVLPPIFPMPIPGGVTPDIPMPAIPPLMPAPELVPI